MPRRFQKLVVFAVAALAAACADAGTVTEPIARPSYDRQASDPPKGGRVTLLSGQLPTNQLFASKMIGEEGGTLRIEGGLKDGVMTYHQLSVPAGAVNEPLLFTMTLSSREYIEVDLNAYKFKKNGAPDEVGHHGFKKPVYLELSASWATTPLDPARLDIVYLVGNRVKEHVKSNYSNGNGKQKSVIGELQHFSRYAMAAN